MINSGGRSDYHGIWIKQHYMRHALNIGKPYTNIGILHQSGSTIQMIFQIVSLLDNSSQLPYSASGFTKVPCAGLTAIEALQRYFVLFRTFIKKHFCARN